MAPSPNIAVRSDRRKLQNQPATTPTFNGEPVRPRSSRKCCRHSQVHQSNKDIRRSSASPNAIASSHCGSKGDESHSQQPTMFDSTDADDPMIESVSRRFIGANNSQHLMKVDEVLQYGAAPFSSWAVQKVTSLTLNNIPCSNP